MLYFDTSFLAPLILEESTSTKTAHRRRQKMHGA